MKTSRFQNLPSRLFAALFLTTIFFKAAPAFAQPTIKQNQDNWFNTIVAHWADYSDAEYVSFIDQARPEVAQVGFYGVTFYSLAHTPFGSGYPAHMPVQGINECGQWFQNLNREIHQRGTKVVGHFNTTFIFGDPELKTGFFQWYQDGWDEKVLGARPVADPTQMLQKDAEGKLISTRGYNIGGWPEYHGCLNNPAWRACLKAMVKAAIARDVDGLIANYFYRRDCMCEYCQSGFRAYLAKEYSAAQLREQMGIDDIKTYQFTAIPSWHDPKETSPYKMAALRWTQIALKQDFDDVFIDYGRQLKPNLMVAQWNHIGNFSQISGDERSAMPGELWGRGEDYLWYSTGNAHSQTDLAKGDLGDGTLQLRYIRGAFGAKPFLLGKYEQTRIRASIAEGVANGGAGMGFYAPHKNPIGRDDFVRYFAFLRRNREYYRSAQPASELVLLYPRSAVHSGNVAPVERFKAIGKRLLQNGYAFDVLPDDILNAAQLNRYRAVISCDDDSLNDQARNSLSTFKGARLKIATPEIPLAFDANWNTALTRVSQRVGAPTVLLSLLSQPENKRIVAHFVNYNREEPAAGAAPAGRGPQDEKPIAVENITVRIQIPGGRRLKSIQLLSPDNDISTVNNVAVSNSSGSKAANNGNQAPLIGKSTPLKFKADKTTATFVVPRVLVYAIAILQFK